MVNYNIVSLAHNTCTKSNQLSLSNINENSSFKFTNSNTNIIASPHIDDLLDDLKHELLELGYNTTNIQYAVLKSPAYKEYTRNLHDNINLKQCSLYGDTYSDINNHHAFKPVLCGDKNRCIVDSNIYTSQLSVEAFELLLSVSDTWRNNTGEILDFWDDTFTLPKEVQYAVNEAGNEGKLLFWRAIREFYTILHKGLPSECINHQTWSTHHPLGDIHEHNHVFGLNLFYSTESLDNPHEVSNFFTVNSFVDTDMALSVWYGCVKRLCSRLNIKMPLDIESGEKKLVWNHNYIPFDRFGYTMQSNGKRKPNYALIKHAINYDMRKPVGDIVKWFDSDDYDGKLNKDQFLRLAELTSNQYNKKSHQWIGWLSDGRKNHYMAKLGLYVKTKKQVLEELKEVEKLDVFICPIDGEDMILDNEGELSHIKDCPNYIILNESMRKGRREIKRVVPLVTDSIDDEINSDDDVINALIVGFTGHTYEEL